MDLFPPSGEGGGRHQQSLFRQEELFAFTVRTFRIALPVKCSPVFVSPYFYLKTGRDPSTETVCSFLE